MTVKKYDGASAVMSFTDEKGVKQTINGALTSIDESKFNRFKDATECLAPPKWRGSDGRCNSCLFCAPEKFGVGRTEESSLLCDCIHWVREAGDLLNPHHPDCPEASR